MAKDALATSEALNAEKIVGADLRVRPSEEGGLIRFGPAPEERPTSVTHGEVYSRKFQGGGPWEASEQEWDLFLRNTGVFKKL